MNRRGVIPIFFLVIAAAAIAFICGVKAEQRVIDQTMVCHSPGEQK